MTSLPPPRMILDCDPGLDDAIAIALALAHADVVGITTVGGNVGVEHTTANAIAVTELLGRPDVPVHAGHDEPLAGTTLRRAIDVHGPTGTGDVTLTATREPASEDAVGFIIDAARAEPGLWLVATGPLTNVAHALHGAPDLVEHLAGISWMGGSATHGNTTIAAEFNAYADPEAAAVVFRAGVPNLTMAGLNVTLQVLLDQPWLDALGAEVHGRPSALLVELLRFYEQRTRRTTTLAGTPVHDALAVVGVTHPRLVAGRRLPVQVLTEGAARGMTLIDDRPARDPEPGNCTVLEWADPRAIRELVAGALTRA